MVNIEEGYEVCPNCKGQTSTSFCFRCYGTGKIDWVEKVVRNQNINTPLTKLNSKLMINYMKHVISKYISYNLNDPPQNLGASIKRLLESIRERNRIKDYEVIVNQWY